MTKNKKRNFAFKICTLFVMTFLCIISFVLPTKAYYINDEGNLQGSNLINSDLSFSQGGGSGSFSNQNSWFTFNVSNYSDFYIYTTNSMTLDSGTYTFSLSSYNNIQLFVIIVNGSWLTSSPSTHTLTFETETEVSLRIDSNENFMGVFSFGLMINSGNVAMSWEPYGTWYSETNYDNNGVIQYGQGYREGKNDVYDSLTYQNISRLVNNVALAKYDTSNYTFVNRPNINSVSFEGNDLVVAWSTTSNDNDYWYHLVLSWSTNSIIKDVGFTPSRFSNVILDINGYQMSNVNYNGSYFGFFNINEQYNTPCNTLTLMFKMNRSDIFENVHINIQGFNENIQIASEQYNEGYEQGVSVGKAEGYSTGFSEGVNQATRNVIGWKGLFFSMADLPFKTVSNFLGFEVLGVNLFKAFIGFITVLGILWVFKRLVK